jgi:polyisoprenoid-binding protein YceI
MPFTLAGVKPHPSPDLPCTDVAGVKATLKINRLDYNVGDGKFVKMGMIGENVEITIFMEALSERDGCKK